MYFSQSRTIPIQNQQKAGLTSAFAARPSTHARVSLKRSISWARHTRLSHSELVTKRKLHCFLIFLCFFIAILGPTYFFLRKQNYSFTASTEGITNSVSGKLFGQKHSNSLTDNFPGHFKCLRLRKPSESEIQYRHKYWQVQQDGQEEIVVYSAFYDDRTVVGILPWIRILGVRRVSDEPLWCYVWYSETEIPFVTEVEIIRSGADQTVEGGKHYSQNLFSCQLNISTFIPTHVSVATRLCANSTIFLEVIHLPKPKDWIHNFGACLEVNFGYFPPESIVEWMEAYALFGVTHVSVYNGSIDSKLDRVFDYYRQKGIVELHQMPPAVEDYSIAGIRLGSPASLNDCMMRNMYTHRFLVVVDFDEIIVPRIHSNYLEMIQYIDQSENRSQSHHTYSFRNAYFFKYFPEDESQPKFLKTLRLRHRVQPSDNFLFGTKSFIDPRRCKSVFNHYCWVRFPNSGRLSVDVNTSVALSHHYRSACPFNKIKCENYNKENVVDNIMLKYKDELLRNVSAALNTIRVKDL